MLEINETTNTFVMVLELPESSQAVTAEVTLALSDRIRTESGQVKVLNDCKLSDLQGFADMLEAEVKADYELEQLPELAEDDLSRVKTQVLNKADHVKIAVFDESEKQLLTVGAWQVKSVVFAKLEELLAQDEEETPVEDVVVDGVVEMVEFAPAGDDPTPSTEEADEEAEPEETETTPEPQLEATAEVEEPVAKPARQPRSDIRILGLRRPSYHPTAAAADVLINEPAFRNSQAHALTSLNKEVAGVLVGPRPEKQEDGRYVVHVTDIIIAKHTRMQGASVTYTPESWRYIHDVLAVRYPNEEALIVGWYHTHPGFGIFLSGMDLFIHQNFFTQPWHIAFVLDPVARRSGFFTWNRPKKQVERYDFPWPRWAATSW